MGLPPPSGPIDSRGPDVPEWTLSTDDGKVHRFRDLNTLQKWIVERKVGRTERISRAGGPWLALEDVVELTPFFNVVDEADRARASTGIMGGMPTAPTFPSPSGGWNATPAARAPSGPIPAAAPRRTGATPPPLPPDARRISEDGPTVPNRRISTDAGDGSDSGKATGTGDAIPAPLPAPAPAPTAAVAAAPRPLPGMRDSVSAARPRSPSNPTMLAVAANEGRRRAGAALPGAVTRPGLAGAHNITAETHPLESELSSPSHGIRNAVLALTLLLLVGAGGGFLWWKQQQQQVARATEGGDSAAGSPQAGASAAAPGEPTAVGLVAPTSPGRAAPAGSTAVDKSANGAGSPPAGAGSADPRRGRAAPGADMSRSPAGSYERLVADADRLLERGKSAKAEKLYAQALELRPDGVAALTGVGYVLLDRQRHFKAIETFRRALVAQPAFGPALFGIAESYRARGDTAQALGAYRQYLAIAPAGVDAPAARRQIAELESADTSAARPDDAAAHRSSSEGQPSEQDSN